MTQAKRAISDRKHFDSEKHSRLWEVCQRRVLPLTREQDRMDAKWGFQALPRLVGSGLAEKWAVTQDNLWQALDEADELGADEQQVFANVDACVQSGLRGLAAMDAEAHARNPQGVSPPESFEWNRDGQHFVVVADATTAAFLPKGLRVVTMTEVAVAIAYLDKAVSFEAAAQEHFPQARLVQDVPEDEIEF